MWLIEQSESGRALVHIMDAVTLKETATIALDMSMQEGAEPSDAKAPTPSGRYPQAVIVPHMTQVWVAVGKKVAVIDSVEQRVHAYLTAHDHDVTAMFSGAESGPFTSGIRKQIWTGDARYASVSFSLSLVILSPSVSQVCWLSLTLWISFLPSALCLYLLPFCCSVCDQG